MSKKALAILIVAAAIILQPCISAAQSDYEFYFFGINLKAFKNSNWLMITTGAVTSMLAHELGHALYLESQGKEWGLSGSSAGLAVSTNNNLTDSQYRNLGRSGFAFQAGIGALLTTFESTRRLDFTKGWVCMNAAQLWTYDHRQHKRGDDFALIERGNGDKRLDFGALALISQNNLVAIASPNPIFFNVPAIANTNKTLSAWQFDAAIGQDKAARHAWTPSKIVREHSLSLNQTQSPGVLDSDQQETGLFKSAISYLTLSPVFE